MIYVPAPPRRIIPFSNKPDEYTIYDQKASEYEYYVAAALEQLDLEFYFQINILGGRKARGGFVVDFLVLTVPLPTPMWVHGEYWHKGKQKTEDAYQLATINYMMRGKMNLAIVLFGEDLQTPEQALITVKKALHV